MLSSYFNPSTWRGRQLVGFKSAFDLVVDIPGLSAIVSSSSAYTKVLLHFKKFQHFLALLMVSFVDG